MSWANNTKPINPNSARFISREKIEPMIRYIHITTICRSGVVYLISHENNGGGMTVAYNPDGSLRTCK